MEIASDDRGGGATTTLQSLTSQHSTLRESFIASDLAETTPANPVSGDHRSVAPVSAVTLGAVLNYEKKSPPPATASFVVRTLLDIIKNDEITNRNQGLTGKKSWKFLKDRLRFKRVISAAPIPQHNILLSSNHRHLRGTLSSPSLRRIGSMREDDPAVIDTIEGGGGSAGSPRAGGVRLAAALAAEREQTRRSLSRELVEDEISGDVQGGNEAAEESAPQPARMSLMDLLEETDRQAGVSGPTYRLFDEDEVEVAEEVVSVGGGDGGVAGGGGYSCCVCMVRHKGAAFIPCGHTFCRLCSRELWVQRGNCPICNNFILEILDIF